MICIYHSRDLDGWMSAAIVKHWHENVKLHPDGLGKSNLTLIGWDYGQPIPEIPDNEKAVVMVDVSWPKEEMEKLKDGHYFLWIDHHISAIKELAPLCLGGLRDEKFAACELAWKFFFPDIKMPELVRLLGRYDCFGHKGTSEERTVLQFQYGARSYISNVDEAYRYLKIAKEFTEIILQSGKDIYNYLCTEAEQIFKDRFTVEFDGYYFAAINRARFNPVNFGIDYHAYKANDVYFYDGVASFHWDGTKWCFSLYNDNGKVDCSEICKRRGGGGHKGAAGFVTKTIDWMFK